MNEEIDLSVANLHRATQKACRHWAPIVLKPADKEDRCKEDAALKHLPASSSDDSGKGSSPDFNH